MCSCTENGKMGENQIWDLQYAPTTQYAHCTGALFRKCDFTATGNLVSDPFRKDYYQLGILKVGFSLMYFPPKGQLFLPSWAGQYQGLSSLPSFPVAGSFSQREPHHSLCVVHNGLATHMPEPSTDSEVLHRSIHFCQTVPFFNRLCPFFVRFYPFLFDFFNFCPMGLATQNENHIDRGVTSRSYFTSRSSWCIRTRFYTATVTDTNLIAPKTISQRVKFILYIYR